MQPGTLFNAISKKVVYSIAIGVGVLIALLLLWGKFQAFDFGRSGRGAANAAGGNASQLVAGSTEKFAFLSGQVGQRSVVANCSMLAASVEALPDDARIQGGCCSPMDLAHYQQQIQDLKKYADIPQIPSDPYDMPVSLAKQLIGYQKTIQLTPDQQAVYDQAVEMSTNHGPCCCKCWRWDAFEGQAKYLISELHWSAKEIANIWDLDLGCGGPGNPHGQT